MRNGDSTAGGRPRARFRKAAICPRPTASSGQNRFSEQPRVIPAAASRLISSKKRPAESVNGDAAAGRQTESPVQEGGHLPPSDRLGGAEPIRPASVGNARRSDRLDIRLMHGAVVIDEGAPGRQVRNRNRGELDNGQQDHARKDEGALVHRRSIYHLVVLCPRKVIPTSPLHWVGPTWARHWPSGRVLLRHSIPPL